MKLNLSKNCSLPGKVVNIDKKKYFIHGLFHDSCGVYLSDEFKQKIKRIVSDWKTICEDGLVKCFNLENSEIFDEIQILRAIDIYTFMNYLAKGLFFRYRSPTNKSLLEDIRRMNTIEDLVRLRERINYPIEPEGLNNLAKINGNSSFIDVSPKKSFRILRYIFEAKRSIDYSIKENMDELHILVGCSHENPLEYLISNSKLIDNYMEKHKIDL